MRMRFCIQFRTHYSLIKMSCLILTSIVVIGNPFWYKKPDYFKKSQKTSGILGNFSVVYWIIWFFICKGTANIYTAYYSIPMLNFYFNFLIYDNTLEPVIVCRKGALKFLNLRNWYPYFSYIFQGPFSTFVVSKYM